MCAMAARGFKGFSAPMSLDNPLLRPRTPVGVRKTTSNERTAGEYRAYTHGRYTAAEHATRGNLMSPAGRKAGIDPGQWFTGRQVSTKYASEELKDWLKAHGPTLSLSEYRAQSIDTPRAASERDARTAGS